MNKDLEKINETDENFKLILEKALEKSDLNTIKTLKNIIYEKASETFVYNIKRLITVEGTQKKLAEKMGISPDLLSKYKLGEAFPSIETLIYTCHIYNLDIYSFLFNPLTELDIKRIHLSKEYNSHIFRCKHFVYYLESRNNIKEFSLNFGDKNIFLLKDENNNLKECFCSHFIYSKNSTSFNILSEELGNVHVIFLLNTPKPQKHLGGIAAAYFFNENIHFNKMLFSKFKINTELYHSDLLSILDLDSNYKKNGIELTKKDIEISNNFLEKIYNENSSFK